MRFNTLKAKTAEIVNHEGASAFSMTHELELYTAVVTASLSDNFYEKGGERVNRIIELVAKVDTRFLAQLAVYTREKMYLRTIPMVLAVELAKVHNGDNLVKNMITRVVGRADEITELLAYYQMANKRNGTKKLNKLSKQVQKGLAEAFNKFDEYQFAKYNRDTVVSLRDALFLVHPKAKDETQQAIFTKIVNDTLQVPYTWEVELSKLGQQPFASEKEKSQAVRSTWEELISSGKLGYMALMRNLRNILQAEVSTAHIQLVGKTLTNAAGVRKSKQLPFRFLAAYREIEQVKSPYSGYIMECLEKAIMISAENIRGFDLHTKVLIASDVSGSMYSPLSKNSAIQCYDIGLMLSMLLRSRSKNVVTGIFGERWMTVNLPESNVLANVAKLRSMQGQVGYATNGHLVISDLTNRKQVMDKVLFFTDLQMWDSRNGGDSLSAAWARYKKEVAPQAKLYLFDLMGYGQSPIRLQQNDVYLLAGWSDKVFDVLSAIEDGSNALAEIQKIEV